MRVIYIAEDGKEFDDEYDCQEYEWILNHPHLKDICFYDANDKTLGNITSEGTYNLADRIEVPNEEALNDLRELGEYCGFSCYEDINECGEWIFNYEQAAYIKTSKKVVDSFLL
jgi:hypothetical protein